jgi:hypothetical protein
MSPVPPEQSQAALDAKTIDRVVSSLCDTIDFNEGDATDVALTEMATIAMRLRALASGAPYGEALPIEQNAPTPSRDKLQQSRPLKVSELSGADLDRAVAGLVGVVAPHWERTAVEVAVDDLDGHAMDFAVALALGKSYDTGRVQPLSLWVHPGLAGEPDRYSMQIPSYTSAEKADFVGGLVLKEGIFLKRLAKDLWQASLDLDEGDALVEDRAAPTAQLAVLRCFVASRLGSHVAVAREYVQEAAGNSAPQRERGG